MNLLILCSDTSFQLWHLYSLLSCTLHDLYQFFSFDIKVHWIIYCSNNVSVYAMRVCTQCDSWNCAACIGNSGTKWANLKDLYICIDIWIFRIFMKRNSHIYTFLFRFQQHGIRLTKFSTLLSKYDWCPLTAKCCCCDCCTKSFFMFNFEDYCPKILQRFAACCDESSYLIELTKF